MVFWVNQSYLKIRFTAFSLSASDVSVGMGEGENKLQHFANEHDTTLWRQHRFVTGMHMLSDLETHCSNSLTGSAVQLLIGRQKC